MFGIGMPEMILILAVALIVIGPKKLPDLARSLGKAMGEFKKATSELKDSMQIDTELKDLKTAFNDLDGDKKKKKNSTGKADFNASEAEVSEPPPESGNPTDEVPDPMDTFKSTVDPRNTEDPQAKPPTRAQRDASTQHIDSPAEPSKE